MDFNFSDLNYLPWLIPVGPLVAFVIISLATNRSQMVRADDAHHYGGHHPDYDGMRVPVDTPLSRIASVTVGMLGVLIAWLISMVVFFNAIDVAHFGTPTHIYGSSLEWMSLGKEAFRMGVLVDPLTVAMLAMVPMAILCIFIYSIGYMAHDPRQSRFFAMIALFGGAMLTLVMADNLLLMFVGWEIMGLCSYLLIGFWFEKESAYNAAIKAFTTTRIADVIMLLGIAYLYMMSTQFYGYGTLNFREILYNTEFLAFITGESAIIFGGLSAASVIGIFLIIGTIGKSAQFPLHVWLPDAMEGPTPVSAMIHAAAMVSAGVYAVIRMYPLFAFGGDPHHGDLTEPMMLMTIVGGFTAFFAATIAVAQNDVKRVLAYSTISQLGFMVAALGIGAYVAAAFHLITHGFFKALLFMASGSVIHAMEHGEHHVHEHDDGHHDAHEEEPFDPQDMMNMGGLRNRIPVTWWTFLAGGLSLAGFPLITAGFWSKDEILADAWAGVSNYYLAHTFVFVMLAAAAFLTAFYTARQLLLTFWGDARSEAAKHAGLGGPTNIISITMQLPLIILAVFAIFAGFAGVPRDFPIIGWFMDAVFGVEGNIFHHVIETLPVTSQGIFHVDAPSFNWIPVLASFSVALGGLSLGWWMYGREPLKAGDQDPVEKAMMPHFAFLYNGMRNKWYVDELYAKVIVAPGQWFARVVVSEFIDNGVIDGTLHFIGRAFTFIGDLFKVVNLWLIDGVGDGIPEAIENFGKWFRNVQSGRAQQYMLLAALGALIIGVAFAVSTGVLAAG
jgi:NADH-quinone oxidoreductase subunit L